MEPISSHRSPAAAATPPAAAATPPAAAATPPLARDTTPTGRRTRKAINQAINALLEKQSGLVGYDQLSRIGLSAESIGRRVDNGELHQRVEPPRRHRPRTSKRKSLLPGRGVFSSHSGPLTLDALRWRAVLTGPHGSRLGSISSCVMHDLERQRGTTMHIVYPGSGWRPSRGVVGHGTSQLHESDLIEFNGLPGVSVGRSVFDAARQVDQDQLDGLMDRAIDLHVYDEADLRRRLDAHRPDFPGAQALKAAIDGLDDKSGEFRSWFERKTTRLVETSKLIPPPVVNVLVEGFRPDLRFPNTRAIVECDGADYHRSLAQVIADERREEILHQLGYVILRLRWSQVRYEPERTLRRIEQFVLANLDPPVPRW